MFAEFEREMNVARTREKRKETAKQGHWLGGYPPENRKVIDDDTYKTILNEFIKLWDKSDSRVREDLMKTVIQSLISHVDNDNTGDIEINFLADKKLEAEWAEIKKCDTDKQKDLSVRTS
ncbi:hypothetical protein LQ318_00615 [Aliifodinibius salicampi]|uniref:Resolvase/invertase-type recombinase catalytic domain-containing protein n=1 Tax=Fodinibius salicampi TaxID=1920655 RepID=A0ABT3PU72_9BACT|nr:hypothetical protein [Fodinibius salicampi]MCW9711392.1 hypothetical protein [Fodinibius salicampi]